MIGGAYAARAARQAALRALEPHVLRFASAYPDCVPDWREPYPLGVVSAASTAIALACAPGLSEAALGDVQTRVVAALSGEDREGIGDAIAHLSTLCDPDFILGWGAGLTFAAALRDCAPDQPDAADAVSAGSFDLWRAVMLRDDPAGLPEASETD